MSHGGLGMKERPGLGAESVSLFQKQKHVHQVSSPVSMLEIT